MLTRPKIRMKPLKVKVANGLDYPKKWKLYFTFKKNRHKVKEKQQHVRPLTVFLNSWQKILKACVRWCPL